MSIVARPIPRRPRRWAALGLAAAVVASACNPGASGGPSVAPSATAPSASAVPGSACTPARTLTARDWNERVWYEVFVRSFADSDGDGTGDLRGLTAKLDYLNDGNPATTTDLGVGGLWLMPIMESPSYHGYDVIDYRSVESDYGTAADFRAFLAAAHQRGIKVILDLVMNHTSSENPWFKDAATPGSAHDDWYVWATENPHYLGPDGQVVWHPLGDRWFYGVFWEGMPDLNLRNAAVTAELEDIARFWLQDMGVDGFRLDAAKHLIEDGKQQVNTPETLAWLKGFHAAVATAKPGSLLVGEVWDISSTAGRYVPDSLDLTFDFGLATGLRVALDGGIAAPITTALGDTLTSWPLNQEATFLTNHDQNRIMSQLRGDVPAAKLAAFMLMTQPGAPFVYYGEEIGMQGMKPDERIRTPMPWSGEGPAGGFSTAAPWEALGDDWTTVNVAAQSGDPASLLSTYRDAIALRMQHPALRDGDTVLVDGGAPAVSAWLRTTPAETLLTVVNLSPRPVDAYALKLASGPLCGPLTGSIVGTVGGDPAAAVTIPAVSAGGGLDAWQPLAVLPPRSGYVLALEPAP
jgi:alpha-amylase